MFKKKNRQTDCSPSVIAVEVGFCRCKWSVFPPQGATGQPSKKNPKKQNTQTQVTLTAAIETND